MSLQSHITINELTRFFGEIVAVNRLSLNIKKGTFFGLLGPNGAGKTTLVEMVTGQLKPTSGNASVLGYDVEAERMQVKKVIGIVSDEPKLYGYLTAREMITFAGRLYGVSKVDLSQRTQELLNLLSLEDKADKMCKELSHGMQKKVELACALVHKPQLLFLDEPFSGIDPVDAITIKNTLKNLTEHGITVWINSHLIFVIETLCDQIALLHRGQLLTQGTVESIKQQADDSESLEAAFTELTELQPKEGNLSF